MTFHDVRFPTNLAFGATGGPERRTDIVTLGSGAEERNARWQNSRRMWNIGSGIRALDDLHQLVAFFEERRGRLHGFRFRDPADWKSCPPQQTPSPTDQVLGTATGPLTAYRLRKAYGTSSNAWHRTITKPVDGTVRVAVDGTEKTAGQHFSISHTTGVVTFLPGHIPPPGAIVTAGFAFDVPVRFDTDKLEIDVSGIRHGAIPQIPIVEIRVD
jgi:uncharacterized protein (TIGR02217 family)